MEDGPAKNNNNKTKKSHKTKEPYDGPREYRTEEKKKEKKKQLEEKEAPRNMQKGENDIKEEQVEKGLRTSPHKSAQK